MIIIPRVRGNLNKLPINKGRFFATFLLIFFLFFVDLAKAIEYGGFGGRPAYPRADNPRTESIYVHTLEPGSEQKEGVLVVNNTNEKKVIMIDAVDSTPSTGGAFACAQSSEEKKDVGAWITLNKTEVTLPSKSSELVDFYIRVPKNASVGEHNGCIVMQEKKDKPDIVNQSGASISFRTGLRVAITIPGELKRHLDLIKFEVQKAQEGKYILKPFVKNTGNVSIDAEVLVFTNYFFGLNLTQHGGQYPILRGETSDWNFELNKPFWGGWYYTQAVISYDENVGATVGKDTEYEKTKLFSEKIWFWSSPTWPALLIELTFLLFLILLVVYWLLKKQQKKWIKESWQDYVVKEGEDLNQLAKRFGVSWKLLAKVNKLKPPYALKENTKIRVPNQK